MPCNHQRREFLGGLTTALGVFALNGMSPMERLAYAAENAANEYKDRYFILLNMYGGWDLLLTLDPRDPSVFTESQKANTLIQPGYQYLQTLPPGGAPVVDTSLGLLGGFMGDMLNHTDKMAIVRGISMDTLAHATAFRRLLTGKAPVGLEYRGSSFDVWAASLLGKDDILSNIAIQIATVNLDQPGYASAMSVGSVNGVYNALNRISPYTDATESAIQTFLSAQNDCPTAQKSSFKQKANVSREKIAAVLEAGLSESFNLNSNTPKMKAVRAFYDNYNTLAMRRVAGASQAIKNGVSRVVSAQIGSASLDSHGSLTVNGPRQLEGFNAMARLIEDLSTAPHPSGEGTWFDRTTILLASEFSRTPLINTQMGRDHWLMNAFCLAGGGIKGGTVVGASSDIGMLPQPTNLATGEVDFADGEVLKPEHIYQTLLKSIGVSGDPADLRVDPITALLKS
jgi:uncharacterized protein (DUF1501 family)